MMHDSFEYLKYCPRRFSTLPHEVSKIKHLIEHGVGSVTCLNLKLRSMHVTYCRPTLTQSVTSSSEARNAWDANFEAEKTMNESGKVVQPMVLLIASLQQRRWCFQPKNWAFISEKGRRLSSCLSRQRKFSFRAINLKVYFKLSLRTNYFLRFHFWSNCSNLNIHLVDHDTVIYDASLPSETINLASRLEQVISWLKTNRLLWNNVIEKKTKLMWCHAVQSVSVLCIRIL